MKETKHKSLQCEIYDQLASMSCARIRKKCGIISFTNEVYEAFVVFHENSLMELSIKEKKTGDTPFYIHFEAREPRSARDNFQAFFDFFKDKTPAKERLDVDAAKNGPSMKLLVSCTSGLTSSYFAYTMKNALEKAGIDITIDAVSYTEIDKMQSLYPFGSPDRLQAAGVPPKVWRPGHDRGQQGLRKLRRKSGVKPAGAPGRAGGRLERGSCPLIWAKYKRPVNFCKTQEITGLLFYLSAKNTSTKASTPPSTVPLPSPGRLPSHGLS